ncbi:MAG: helix-turn-helix transcriptional regulator [Methylobacteriaceae bacterium]|nr:helix-turn-helix transcriptional regulator [Methylobacteriaceae bacterium]
MTYFPQRMRVAMAFAGVKGIDLARDTGIPQSRISELLGGKKEPTVGNAIAIAQRLNVTLDWLFEDKEPLLECA